MQLQDNVPIFSPADPGIRNSFQEQGFAVVENLIAASVVAEIRNDFLQATADVNDRYKLGIQAASPEELANAVFATGGNIRRNLYGLFQELNSITALVAEPGLRGILSQMGLRFPVIRNQALRIDFANEPQYLQGIHQDVRGMRSSNCVNFWIPLQEVNEQNGSLAVYPLSHLEGGIIPKALNSAGYQIFTEEDCARFDKIILNLRPGHVLMFHPYLFHASYPSNRAPLRLTVTLRFDDIADMDWLQSEKPVFDQLDIQDKSKFS